MPRTSAATTGRSPGYAKDWVTVKITPVRRRQRGQVAIPDVQHCGGLVLSIMRGPESP